jgi:hypothetical protein
LHFFFHLPIIDLLSLFSSHLLSLSVSLSPLLLLSFLLTISLLLLQRTYLFLFCLSSFLPLFQFTSSILSPLYLSPLSYLFHTFSKCFMSN